MGTIMPDWMTLARATLCRAYKYSGALSLHEAIARAYGQRFMTILLFHRVTDVRPEDGLTVSTARFRRICEMIARRRGRHRQLTEKLVLLPRRRERIGLDAQQRTRRTKHADALHEHITIEQFPVGFDRIGSGPKRRCETVMLPDFLESYTK